MEGGGGGALLSVTGLFHPTHNLSLSLLTTGGLAIFTLRRDCFDMEDLGYAAVINKLIEDKKWEMISNDLIDYVVGPRTPERYHKCYVFVFKVL